MNRFFRLSLAERTNPNPLRQEEKGNLIFFYSKEFWFDLTSMDV